MIIGKIGYWYTVCMITPCLRIGMMVSALLLHGMEHTPESRVGIEELFDAVKRGDQNKVIIGLNQGCNVNSVSSRYPYTLLHCAANNFDVDMMRMLIAYGADSTWRIDGYGNVFNFAWGLRSGSEEKRVLTYKVLFKAVWLAGDLFDEVVLNLISLDKLHKAICDNNVDALCEELSNGYGVNEKDELGATPLMYAAGGGYVEMVKFLLKQGSNPLLKNDAGKTVFDIIVACSTQYECTFKYSTAPPIYPSIMRLCRRRAEKIMSKLLLLCFKTMGTYVPLAVIREHMLPWVLSSDKGNVGW